MKRRDLFGNRMLSHFFAGMMLAVCCSPNPLLAQLGTRQPSSDSDLEVHWRSTTSRQSGVGELVSAILWPHSTDRVQEVVVYRGSRELERVSGQMLDREAKEKQILSSTFAIDEQVEGKGKDRAKADAPVMTIGLEGSRKKAQKTEDRLRMIVEQRMGKANMQNAVFLVTDAVSGKVEAFDSKTRKSLWTKSLAPSALGPNGRYLGSSSVVEHEGKTYDVICERVEIDRPTIYLVLTMSDGTIQTLNAETGETLWQTTVGTSVLPTLASGVSDEYVTAINGSELYVLSLLDGSVLNQRRCERTAAGGAVPFGPYIFVPCLDGTMIGYRSDDPLQLPWTVRSGGRGAYLPAISPDKRFIAWCNEPSFVYLAKLETPQPKLWNRFETRERVVAAPVATPTGFVVANSEGTTVKLNIPTQDENAYRASAIAWRHNSGKSQTQGPVVGSGLVFQVTSDDELIALDEETGSVVWDRAVIGIKQAISSNTTHVYCRSVSDDVVAIDLKSGMVTQKFPIYAPRILKNSVNDRIYVMFADGGLACLRAKNLDAPVMHYKAKLPEAPSKKSKMPSTTSDTPSDDDSSPFGSGLGGSADEPVGSDDPFGDSAPSSDDPFGDAGGDSSNDGDSAAGDSDPFGDGN